MKSAADARWRSPSRIGKEPVKLADGVTATIAGQKVTVKGKLGELSYSGRQLRFNKKNGQGE